MVANTPGILPKTALVGSRVIYYPFTIPQKLTDSSYLVGQQATAALGGVNAAIGNAYAQLKPRGPAKWLLPLFKKVDDAVQNNDKIAMRNKTVFWDPISQGAEGIGRAFAGPGAYWYLRKAGVEQPTTDMIKGVLNMPLFSFPVPSGGGEQQPPADNAAAAEAAAQQQAAAQQAAAAEAAAQQGAQQAAEGAGQTGAAA
jgi:hypothetical protein